MFQSFSHRTSRTMSQPLVLILSVTVFYLRLSVTTEHRVKIRDIYEMSRGINEHLCSKSGARLNGQAGDKKCIEQVNYE